MMKLFLILLITIFTSSCMEFKEVTVTGVDSFKINKIDTKEMQAEIKLMIKNPNNSSFSIYPSEFDIVYGGIHLGKAKLYKRVHIDSNSERAYSFELKSNLGGLNFLDVTKILSGNNLGKLEIKGDLKAGKFYLKKKFPINFSDKVSLF